MKLSWFVLILLCVTACTPQPTVLPQVTQIPIPIVATSQPAITSVAISSTSVPVCTCLTGIVTPTQSQGGVSSCLPSFATVRLSWSRLRLSPLMLDQLTEHLNQWDYSGR